jgi:hypothetical protein
MIDRAADHDIADQPRVRAVALKRVVAIRVVIRPRAARGRTLSLAQTCLQFS